MLRDYPKCRSCLKILKSLCSAGIQSIGVELAGGVLSRPVSPKLAHEAVLAKPPYFGTAVSPANAGRRTGVQNVGARDCGIQNESNGKNGKNGIVKAETESGNLTMSLLSQSPTTRSGCPK